MSVSRSPKIHVKTTRLKFSQCPSTHPVQIHMRHVPHKCAKTTAPCTSMCVCVCAGSSPHVSSWATHTGVDLLHLLSHLVQGWIWRPWVYVVNLNLPWVSSYSFRSVSSPFTRRWRTLPQAAVYPLMRRMESNFSLHHFGWALVLHCCFLKNKGRSRANHIICGVPYRMTM